MTTLKIKLMDGTPAELSLRHGEGEKNHGGAVMRITGMRITGNMSKVFSTEAWLSADDRKCIKGWL